MGHCLFKIYDPTKEAQGNVWQDFMMNGFNNISNLFELINGLSNIIGDGKMTCDVLTIISG